MDGINLKSKRIVSIDLFRGFCIVCMVAQFWLGVFEETFESWNWVKIFLHDEDGFVILPVMALADIFAPCFIFIMGMTACGSLNSKTLKYGEDKADFMLIERYLGIIGVGSALTGIDKILDYYGKHISKGKAFSELVSAATIDVKISMVIFLCAVLILVAMLVSKLCKCEKFQSCCGTVLRHFLAVSGVVMLFTMAGYTGEYILDKVGGEDVSYKFTKLWDTLQNIGLAGLLAFPLIKQKRSAKTLITGLVMLTMAALCFYSDMNLLDRVIEGGLFGAFGWASILVLGSIFSELHSEKNNKTYWAYVAVLYAFALIGSLVFKFPTVKRGCSPAFAAFTSATAAVVFKFFTLFENCKNNNLLINWGSNAIVLYTVNFVLSLIGGVAVTAGFNPGKAGAVVIILVVMAIFSILVTALSKKDKHIRI